MGNRIDRVSTRISPWSQALLLVMVLTGPLYGWGNEGHETVGCIAGRLLQGSAAEKRIESLLGDESLAKASLWADQVKGSTGQTEEMIAFKQNNPRHSVFHYTDIPFQEPSYREDSVGATNVDLVHAIGACVAILRGHPEAQTLYTNVGPKIALRLVVHYLGDLHQPLHVGSGYLEGTNFVNPNVWTNHFESDQGGNALTYELTNRNLHFFWDATAVEMAMRKEGATNAQDFAWILLGKAEPEGRTPANPAQWVQAWADESLGLSAKAHNLVVDNWTSSADGRGVEHSHWRVRAVDPDYDDCAAGVAEAQLAKAGYRLAALLKEIWPDQGAPAAPGR